VEHANDTGHARFSPRRLPARTGKIGDGKVWVARHGQSYRPRSDDVIMFNSQGADCPRYSQTRRHHWLLTRHGGADALALPAVTGSTLARWASGTSAPANCSACECNRDSTAPLTAEILDEPAYTGQIIYYRHHPRPAPRDSRLPLQPIPGRSSRPLRRSPSTATPGSSLPRARACGWTR
jgi:hypothetical protein